MPNPSQPSDKYCEVCEEFVEKVYAFNSTPIAQDHKGNLVCLENTICADCIKLLIDLARENMLPEE
jgi:hypothetical protein